MGTRAYVSDSVVIDVEHAGWEIVRVHELNTYLMTGVVRARAENACEERYGFIKADLFDTQRHEEMQFVKRVIEVDAYAAARRPRVLDKWMTPRGFYYVIEHVPDSLPMLTVCHTRQMTPLSPSVLVCESRASSWFVQLVQIIGRLHQAGIVHRSISPCYVTITADDQAYINSMETTASPKHSHALIRDATFAPAMCFRASTAAGTGMVAATFAHDYECLAYTMIAVTRTQLPWSGMEDYEQRTSALASIVQDAGRGTEYARLALSLLECDPDVSTSADGCLEYVTSIMGNDTDE